MGKYKYLYEIEYLNAKEGQTRFYKGSRISDIRAKDDLWKKYFTSSKLIKKIIAEERKDAFAISEIIEFPTDVNILHEEYKYLVEVDARNNPKYFNQTNNEGYDLPESGNRVCPYCYHKNFGNPFEKCFYCNNIMIHFICKNCGKKLDSPNERCTCGHSLVDNAVFTCKNCGKKLNNSATERCACGYSILDDANFTCKECNRKLNSPAERCTCGRSILDDANFTCKNCGSKISNPNERCSCGYSSSDDVDHICKSCGEKLNSASERCLCGWWVFDDANYTCKNCGNKLVNPNERCTCGYSIVDAANFTCRKCGKKLDNPAERCTL